MITKPSFPDPALSIHQHVLAMAPIDPGLPAGINHPLQAGLQAGSLA
ncbi:MAG: hypothetical protein QNJ69_07650 [Gammaproteobacteria bacterium]|nr:hypothetical protein [Gammaproteobacteria bacterium]